MAITSALSAMSGGSLGTLYVTLTADATKLVAGMNQAEFSVNQATGRMTTAIVGFSTVATVALAAVGAAAAQQAIKFESSFAGVRRTVDATEEQFSKLKQQFRGMSMTIPIDVNEINRVAEAAGQLGVETDRIAEFTKTILMMGTTTNMTTTEAADQMARFANVAQISQKDFDRLGATILKLGQTSAATESEILSMALRIGGAGRQVGMSGSQILGFATSLSSVGIQAEMGGAAISQMMTKIAKAVASGSEDLATFAMVAGQTEEAFSKSFKDNAQNAILQFLSGLGQISKAGVDTFGVLEKLNLDGIRIQDTMLRSSGAMNLFVKSQETANSAWKENEALVTAANKRYETMESQLTITWNRFKDLLITIGDELIPLIKDLNISFRDLTEWIRTTNAETGFIYATFKTLLDVFKAFALGAFVVYTALKSIATVISTYVVVTMEAFRIDVDMIIQLFALWWTSIKGIITGLKEMGKTAMSAGDMLKALATGDIAGIAATAGRLSVEMEPAFLKVTDSIAGAVKGSAAIVEKGSTEMFDMVTGQAEDAVAALQEQWKAVETMGMKMFGPPVIEAAAKVNTEIVTITESTKKAVIALNELTDAQVRAFNIKAASDRVAAQLDKMGMPKPMQFSDPMFSQLAGMDEEKTKAEENLAMLEEMGRREVELTEEVQARKAAAIEAYTARTRELQMAQNMIIVQAGQTAFDSLAQAAAGFAGKQSGIYKAMFAASKAFAIAESIIKIQQGIAAASALPFPANLAAIASVVAATANIVTTIQSVKLEMSGEKAAGGLVRGGNNYLVGERGPEVFSPAQNGTIIPNHSLGGGGGQMRVVVNNFTDVKPEVTEKREGDDRVIEVVLKRVKDEIGAEIRDGRGNITRSMEASYNLRRGK